LADTGALSIQDIDAFIPGFESGDDSFTQNGVTIRGVSTPNISTGGDPSVATFYDDSYVPSAGSTIQLSDIASIQVLKGPQGTLFGRNAAAGVVSI
jgi:iron complex outermembrane receptor protein